MIPGTDPVQRRMELARTASAAYAAHPEVAAVIVGGSVARGLADEYSDLELGIFWNSAPEDEARSTCASDAGIALTHSFPYFAEEDLFLDQGTFSGVRVDLIHRDVDGVDRELQNVLEQHEANVYALNALAVLGYGIPLYGEHLIESWRARITPYPRSLATSVIDAHLEPTPTAWLTRHCERGEWIPLYERLLRDQRNLLMVLTALNLRYVPHAEFKWLDALEQELADAPPGLTARLGGVLTETPEVGISILGELWQETYALVARAFPEIQQTAQARDWLNAPAERFG